MEITDIMVVSKEDLRSLIREEMKECVMDLRNDVLEHRDDENTLLTIPESCKLLEMARCTFWKKAKQYNIPEYTVDGKKFYKKSDLLDAQRAGKLKSKRIVNHQ